MKTIVLAVALCAVMSTGLAPTAKAADGPSLTSPMMVAEDQKKGPVERCVKWIQKKIQEKVNGKLVTRTVAVCAVRG